MRRNPVWVVALLVLIHLVLAALVFDPTPHTGGDNAGYIALGRSLLQRHAYLELYDPLTPLHTQYPPVFPAILAGAMLAGLHPWVGLKLVIVAFSALAIALSFLWIRRRQRPGLALGVALVLAVSPGVLDLSHWILSDVPFWAFTMLALWGFERLRPELRLRFAVALGALVLAYFTRSAGLPLLVAVLVWLAWRRRGRQLAVTTAVIVPLVFLWWWRAHVHGGVSYASQFWAVNPLQPDLGRIGLGDLAARVGENAGRYLLDHLPILLGGRPTAAAQAGGLLVVTLALVGWVRQVRRPGLIELFVPLYVGLLLVWPAVWSGERFLLPVLPALLFYAGSATLFLGNRLLRRRGPIMGVGLAGLLLVLSVPGLFSNARFGMTCRKAYGLGYPFLCMPVPYHDFFKMAEWSRAALPPGAVVISRKPRLFYVLSGHPSRIYPSSGDPEEFFRLVGKIGARYVVFDRLGYNPNAPATAWMTSAEAYLVPVIVSQPGSFCLMTTTPDGGASLLGIQPDAPPGVPTAPKDIHFADCPDSYWRDAAARALPPPDSGQ